MIRSRFDWLWQRLQRRLWYRTTLISLLGVCAALIGPAIDQHVPDGLARQLGADAVEDILPMLASSMLTVAVFSLSTVVAAFSAATTNASPRATRLLQEDPVTHNALATFIGTFLYSLVGIVALRAGVYGQTGRVVLFFVTLLVLALIVGTLLRWTDYVSRLGRVADTTERVEKATAAALEQWRQRPNLGGLPLDTIDADAEALETNQIGYVQNVDTESLHRCAEKHDLHVYVGATAGTYVDASRALAHVSGAKADDPEVQRHLREAFGISALRSYDQDPRFGFVVLAEVASRALSPAINDPGTAIDVLGRIGRLLGDDARAPSPAPAEPYARVHVPPLRIDDLFDDAFTPIARDGAGLVEVAVRLQKTLRGLAQTDPSLAEAATRHAEQAWERSARALEAPVDQQRVRDAAALVASPEPERATPGSRG